jgi:hypothetical protein
MSESDFAEEPKIRPAAAAIAARSRREARAKFHPVEAKRY